MTTNEVYYSDVHHSWVRRWEEGGEPFSENISGYQAGVLMTGGPQSCPDHEHPCDYCQVCCAFGEIICTCEPHEYCSSSNCHGATQERSATC